MPSISSCRARLCLELLEERCLLSFGLGPTVQVSGVDPFADSHADDPQHQTGTLYPARAMDTFMVVSPTNPDHGARSVLTSSGPARSPAPRTGATPLRRRGGFPPAPAARSWFYRTARWWIPTAARCFARPIGARPGGPQFGSPIASTGR